MDNATFSFSDDELLLFILNPGDRLELLRKYRALSKEAKIVSPSSKWPDLTDAFITGLSMIHEHSEDDDVMACYRLAMELRHLLVAEIKETL